MGLLESLEEARLLFPRIQIRYPDPIARYFWLARREDPSCQLKLPVEADGPRLDDAVALRNALYRWRNSSGFGLSAHPLDDLEPRFAQFIERSEKMDFGRGRTCGWTQVTTFIPGFSMG